LSPFNILQILLVCDYNTAEIPICRPVLLLFLVLIIIHSS